MFSDNSDMASPNPSIFLGNVLKNIVKQMKNSDFHSIFHIVAITATCLTLLKYIQECIWNLQWSVFPQFHYGCSKSINIFRQCFKEHCQTNEKSDFHSILFVATVTENLCLTLLNYIQECIWNLQWIVFQQSGFDQSKSINIFW